MYGSGKPTLHPFFHLHFRDPINSKLRFSTLSAATALLAASTATASPTKPHMPNLDLSKIPVLNLVSALVDYLPVNVDAKVLPGGLSDLSKVDVHKILSCVVDALPVDAQVAALTPSSSAPSSTSTATPSSSPSASTSASSAAPNLDLSKIPVLNIVSAIVDKLPVDVNAKVLPNGLSDLSQVDLQSIASCVVDSLPVDAGVAALTPSPTATPYKI